MTGNSPENFAACLTNLVCSTDTSQRIEWGVRWTPLSLLDGAEIVCVSGGVPLENPLVLEARARGIT